MAVLSPLAWGVVAWSDARGESVGAAQSQTGLRIEPGSQDSLALLMARPAADPDDTPGFVLLRLDAPRASILLRALPGETVLLHDGMATTLAQSYQTAGPARAAQLLAGTLSAPEPEYLAATVAGWQSLFGGATARVDTSRLLSTPQRHLLGVEEAVTELDCLSAQTLLARAQGLPGQGKGEATLSRAEAEALRAAFWNALLRQNPAALAALPEAVRNNSSALLTSLSATDLLMLDNLTAWLCTREVTVNSGVLAGAWTSGGFALNDESLAEAQTLLQ